MSSAEYDMKDLLSLIESEHAEGLSLHPGQPPVVHLKGEPHTVEGPAITPENADGLFRALADTRRVREFRSHGSVDFVHAFQSSQFKVLARAEHDAVYLDLRRLKAQPDAGPNDEERDDV
jgi:Tfp pilus assembly ATPase PilU